MSRDDGEFLSQVGRRFAEERERLGYSQEEVGAITGGTDRKTIGNWESGKTPPKAPDLAKFHDAGADIIYILTGHRAPFVAKEEGTPYLTPARELASELSVMKLSKEDADLILAVARRIAVSGKGV